MDLHRCIPYNLSSSDIASCVRPSSLRDKITILNVMISDEPDLPEDPQTLIVHVPSGIETWLGREMEYQAQ